MSTTKNKWKYSRAGKYMGDDAYSWAVWDKQRGGPPVVSGLSRPEVNHYRQMVENRYARPEGVEDQS